MHGKEGTRRLGWGLEVQSFRILKTVVRRLDFVMRSHPWNLVGRSEVVPTPGCTADTLPSSPLNLPWQLDLVT